MTIGTSLLLTEPLGLRGLHVGLEDNFANGIIIKRLIELAKAGERNPDLLCKGAIEKLRGHLYSD